MNPPQHPTPRLRLTNLQILIPETITQNFHQFRRVFGDIRVLRKGKISITNVTSQIIDNGLEGDFSQGIDEGFARGAETHLSVYTLENDFEPLQARGEVG